MKKSISIILTALIMISVFALTPTANAKAEKPYISYKTLLMKKGQKTTLKLINSKNAKWSSSNKKVVTVSKKGVVKAKKAGTANITAKYKGKKYTCSVTVSAGKKKTLVVYFSATGTTASAAKKVKKAANADIIRLQPRTTYTSKDLDYNNNCRANREQNNPGTRPAIATGIKNFKQYKTVYLGYPIWWGKEPRVIRSFLDKYSMKGKTLIPFCTSGSSGISGSMSGIKAGAKGATVKQGKDLTGASYKSVKKWVDSFKKASKPKQSPTQPATKAPTQKPTESNNTPEPTEPITEAPTTEPVTKVPETSPQTEAPTIEPTTQAPSTETATEIPTTSPVTEAAQPTTDVPETTPETESATTEPATQAPTTEPITENITTEPPTEAPSTEPSTEAPTTDTTEPAIESNKTLVVYFSRTGHTKPLAEYAAEYYDADIFEIEAKIPYTDDDIKYYTDCRADREQKDPTARPEIANYVESMDSYSTIILAYPIWHGQAPKIIYTFLESYDFSGKTIIPFCTSASSGIGSSATNLHPLAPNAIWKDGARFAIGTDKETLTEWLKTFE